MIAQLTGTVVHQGAGTIVLDVNGVGYLVHATPHTAAALPSPPERVTLLTHLVVREDQLSLYGFAAQEEVNFFAMLIGISGIGPKSALGILSLTDIATLKSAVRSQDTSYLTKVSGIGKKGAQKIVFELGDKLGDAEETAGYSLAGDVEALEALRSLGYSTQEAREALRNVPSDITGVNERLKEALKRLGQ